MLDFKNFFFPNHDDEIVHFFFKFYCLKVQNKKCMCVIASDNFSSNYPTTQNQDKFLYSFFFGSEYNFGVL